MVPVIDAADGRWLLTAPVHHFAHVLLYCCDTLVMAGSRWCPLLMLLTAAGC
jgi:hypothetical protein